MANKTAAERKQIRAEFMREMSRDNIIIPCNKTELQAAIDAADDAWDGSVLDKAAYEAALPTPAEGHLSKMSEEFVRSRESHFKQTTGNANKLETVGSPTLKFSDWLAHRVNEHDAVVADLRTKADAAAAAAQKIEDDAFQAKVDAAVAKALNP